jgi:hypothetical protein
MLRQPANAVQTSRQSCVIIWCAGHWHYSYILLCCGQLQKEMGNPQ